MLLKPAAMQRIAVIGLRDQRQRVVSILYDLGVLQIESISKSAVEFLKSELDNANVREVSEELLRIRSLKAALPPNSLIGKKGFATQQELLAASRSLTIDGRVSKLKQDQSKIQTELDELKEQIALVSELEFIDEDMSIFDLESGESFFAKGSAESYENVRKSLDSLRNVLIYSSADKDTARMVVLVPSSELEKFGSVVQRSDMHFERIPKLRGRPRGVLARLKDEKQKREDSLKKIEDELHEISKEYYGIVSSIEEQLSIESRKLDVVNNFGFTENTFVLEGWIPQDKMKSLEEVLARHTKSTEVYAIESDEKPPTLLENPRRLSFFESFIRFYSLPQQGEFDPTFIFAITFPIFFGLMLGDVGYGLAILGICYWILNRLKHPGRRTIIPRMLRSFARNIFKPRQFQKLAMAMVPGAIIGTILGFAFNEYFGFHLNQYLFSYLNANLNIGLPSNGTFFDPISTRGLKDLLLFAGYVGLFEVSFGLVLGIINSYWMNEKKHMFSKLGWLFAAWGISLIGLTVLHHGSVSPTSNPIAGLYIGVFVAGLGLIAYGEGGQSLIELPSIISHVLSYTRLVGILLASIILAQVIDDIFLGSVVGGVGLAVFAVVILVFGQLFNLVLALFEPGIQGARLLYVEFFSKFYHGSGKPFSPFRGGRTHTVREIDLMEAEVSHQEK